MKEVLNKISLIGIVPVIKINDITHAVPLAKALCKGGIPVAEITFRTEQAEEAIRRIKEEIPDMLVGAGTVLTVEQVDQAVKAGAEFIVSPGFNPRIVEHCIKKDIPVAPGCSSPSDVERAMEYGLDVVKFFPAEAAGGIKMIKALSGPYGNMKFMPTGGIDLNNLNDYLSCSKVLACGGSWMVPEDMVIAGEFDKITALCEKALEKMLGFQLAHIGINSENEEAARKTASGFSSLFNLSMVEGNSSIFAGDMIEIMKTPFRGQHGHIAIKTNYPERAIRYLAEKGIEFDTATEKRDGKGKVKSIYLKGETGGFAIHLLSV